MAWLVDKPAGPTSHDVVARIRRTLPRRTRVGHAGTLDPFATGLLVVLAGRATRLARLLSDQPKRYVATVRLGYRSATGDPEGPITPGGPVPDAGRVMEAVAHVRGATTQRVPAYAAVRVDGERMYARARRGEEVIGPERPVVVYDLTVVRYDPAVGELVIDTRVSKGTYIRQLAADIGERLGCGGYCGALRRVQVGDLGLEGAVPPEGATADTAIPLLRLLGHLPRHEVDDAGLWEVRHGRSVPGEAAGEVLLHHAGTVVALAAGDGARLRPRVVLADPPGVAG